jgi:AraC-like DNA-binding protein
MTTSKIMRNTTLMKPLLCAQRPAAEVARWRRQRDGWMATLAPATLFHRLFDFIPGVSFFAKDRSGHIMVATKGIMARYEMNDDAQIIGRTDFDLNPDTMAQGYVDDDNRILSGEAELIERIELWWDRQGMPDWFLVTKLPILDRSGAIQGVMGTLRRPDESERQLPVFQTVAKAVEIIRGGYSRSLEMEAVARSCGQSMRQLQRHFQKAFGITPQEFLIKTRVLAAMRLLVETPMTAGEIAHQCGFIDASSFTSHFRKRTGQTPGTYRAGDRVLEGKSGEPR